MDHLMAVYLADTPCPMAVLRSVNPTESDEEGCLLVLDSHPLLFFTSFYVTGLFLMSLS